VGFSCHFLAWECIERFFASLKLIINFKQSYKGILCGLNLVSVGIFQVWLLTESLWGENRISFNVETSSAISYLV
jgi:hypothetical protein